MIKLMNQIKGSDFYTAKAIEYCELKNIEYKELKGMLIINKNKEEFERELWEYILNDTRTKVR